MVSHKNISFRNEISNPWAYINHNHTKKTLIVTRISSKILIYLHRYVGISIRLITQMRISQRLTRYSGSSRRIVGRVITVSTRRLRTSPLPIQQMFTFECMEKTNIKKRGRQWNIFMKNSVSLVFYFVGRRLIGK